ncbi:DUF4229 domain-containing protein [Pseudonocardiaceae bacterium YIM PH 21723]|nr:DUF4229 domain-containing protein [Pseudonocardiaceae bacterium YIM PH 21723]
MAERDTLVRDVLLYTVARMAMVAAIAAILVLCGVPLLVAGVLAIVVMLPLSLFILAPLRRRVAQGINERQAVRDAEREKLRAQLRGDTAAE